MAAAGELDFDEEPDEPLEEDLAELSDDLLEPSDELLEPDEDEPVLDTELLDPLDPARLSVR